MPQLPSARGFLLLNYLSSVDDEKEQKMIIVFGCIWPLSACGGWCGCWGRGAKGARSSDRFITKQSVNQAELLVDLNPNSQLQPLNAPSNYSGPPLSMGIGSKNPSGCLKL